MSFTILAVSAAWLHHDARSGFEVVFFRTGTGYVIEVARLLPSLHPWIMDYEISVDARWITRRATVTSHTATGVEQTTLQANGAGGWLVNGNAAPQLDGCLEWTSKPRPSRTRCPVHRLALVPGQQADAPAAFVRALDGSVERLEQTYTRAVDDTAQQRFAYSAPAFEFPANWCTTRQASSSTWP